MNGSGLEGLNCVKVTTRVAKRNYGLSSMDRYRDGYHLPIDRIWVEAEDGFFAKDQMQWCLRKVSNHIHQNIRITNKSKGVDIASQDPVLLRFYRLIHHQRELNGGEWLSTVWISEATSPENRKTTDVVKLCDIKVRIDTPFDLLPSHSNRAGKSYRKVAFDIEMTCSGAELKFAAIIDGYRQPTQNVEALFS